MILRDIKETKCYGHTDGRSFGRTDVKTVYPPTNKVCGGIKISEAELWFLCMTYRLIVLYNCMKFHLNSFNGCQHTERTQNTIANDQREITPKISKAELWFLCMTHCLIVLYKRMKFQPNSFNRVQLTERTQNCIYLCYKGNNLKNVHARVMVLVHHTSSQCALQMYEVSLKYL